MSRKIDYYAAPSSGMPKWMGYVLGGVFATIAVGCVVVIVALTRDNTPPPAEKPVVAAAAEPVAEPVADKAPVAKAAVATDERAAAPAKVSKKAAKASKASKRLAAKSKHGKRIMLAKHSTSQADDKARSILAKRDSRQSRKAKDDLDKLLGL